MGRRQVARAGRDLEHGADGGEGAGLIMRPAPFVGLLSRTSLPKLTVPGYAGRLLSDQLEVGSNQLPLEAPVYVLAALAAAAPRRARLVFIVIEREDSLKVRLGRSNSTREFPIGK